MSFGAPVSDKYGFIQPYPAQSMLAGLIGNAMGLRRDEPEKLSNLQDSFVYACREDQPGRKITDYQTVDLGQPHLYAKNKTTSVGWRTDGKGEDGVEVRGGGDKNKVGTHIRYRDYWAGGIYTVALATKKDAAYATDDIVKALRRPARPLFIGRKPCIPSRPILLGLCATESDALPDALIETLQQVSVDSDATARNNYNCWWPALYKHPNEVHRIEVTDRRDFYRDQHVGSRQLAHGPITINHE